MGAPPEWQRTVIQPMPGAGDVAVEAVAVVDGGAATAGVVRDTATGRVPLVLERPAAGATWTVPVRLSGPTRIDVGPYVARNRRGDAVAVWGVVGAPVRAAVRFGGRWSRPMDTGLTMPAAGASSGGPAVRVAMGADRRARLVTVACAAGACRVRMARTARAGAAWTAAGEMRTPRGSAARLGWDLGAGGAATVAWARGARVLAVSRAPGDATWPAPRRVPSGDAAGRLAVDVGPGGEAAVAWSTRGGGAAWSVRLGVDAAWRAPRRVGRPAGAGAPAVGVGCEGGSAVAWTAPGDTGVVVRVSTAQGTEGLPTDPMPIPTSGTDDHALSVALVTVVGRSGFMFAGWSRADRGGAGGSGAYLGDRGQYAVRWQGWDGRFAEGPPPAFAADGAGLLVGADDTGVAFQEYVPGPAVVRCP